MSNDKTGCIVATIKIIRSGRFIKLYLEHCIEIISMKNRAESAGFSLRLCYHLVYLYILNWVNLLYFKRALYIILEFGILETYGIYLVFLIPSSQF